MAKVTRESEWIAPPRGRRWREEDGRAMVASWRRSGLSRSAFGRRHGVDRQRVVYWVDRFEGKEPTGARRRGAAAAAMASFMPVRVVERDSQEPAAPSSKVVRADAVAPALDVVVGGAVVRVGRDFDEEHLRRLVAALAGGVTC